MRRSRFRTLAVALVLLGGAAVPPAHAETPAISEDGAKALAAALKDGLKRWFPQGKDGSGFQWKGEPVVTVAGDHYAVALPALTAADEDGSKVEVGTVLLTVKPRDGGTHAVTATLPDSIPVTDGGKPSATIRIGKQRFAGVWSGAYETLLSVDAEYADLSVTGAKKDGQLSIGAVTVTADLKPDGATTWSGPGAMAISNLSFVDEKKREILKLAALTSEGTYSRLDLARGAEVQRLTQKHALAGTEPPAAELLPLLQGLAGGMSFRTRLTGLSAFTPEDGTRFALNQLSVRGGVEDMDRPLGSASLGFETSGLTLSPPVAPKEFMPDKLDVQVSVAKLPSAALWQALADVTAEAESEAARNATEKAKAKARKIAAAEPAPVPASDRLFAAMAEAGSELRIDKLAVDTPATSGSVTGAARVAANTALGAVGGVTVLLRGLDGAAKALQPKPGQKADKETKDALGLISMLQAMGQVSKDETGRDVRTYKIDMTETGQFLLNGADMGPILGMGGADGGGDEEEEEPAPKKGAKKN